MRVYSGTVEFVGGEHLERNALFRGEGDRVGEVGARQAGRIGDDSQHVAAQHLMRGPGEKCGVHAAGIGDQGSSRGARFGPAGRAWRRDRRWVPTAILRRFSRVLRMDGARSTSRLPIASSGQIRRDVALSISPTTNRRGCSAADARRSRLCLYSEVLMPSEQLLLPGQVSERADICQRETEAELVLVTNRSQGEAPVLKARRRNSPSYKKSAPSRYCRNPRFASKPQIGGRS